MKKETVPIPPQTPEDYVRFWSKVRVVGSEECWEWQATKMPNGYGQFSFKGRHVYAHCPQGHPYSGDNLYLRPDRPGRGCLACRHEASR